jgi:hypothetical protein
MSVPILFVPAEGGARQAHARHVLAGALRKAGATSEFSAAPLSPASRLEESMLRRLVAQGAIRQGRNGGYWLDEARDRELRHARLRLVAMILIVEAGVIAALVLNLPHHPR